MKKPTISKLFLYRQRFRIGFILLVLAFIGLIFSMPIFSPAGLSDRELNSTIASLSVNFTEPTVADLASLPYRLLQRLSIFLLGPSTYAIKLPSVIIASLLGLFLVLLLNRWFKTNVALISSVLAILGSAFLYLSGNGSPLIMLPFWITLVLWLGSKISSHSHPSKLLMLSFFVALTASLFTPLMPYFVFPVIIFIIFSPHFRFTVRTLPLWLRLPVLAILALAIIFITTFSISFGSPPRLLFLPESFRFTNFWQNIDIAFKPFFAWNYAVDSMILSPIISLPVIALALTGLISTSRRFLESKSRLAVALIIFTVIISGLDPSSALIMGLPISILSAYGIKYILEKWYGLFPSNPYARIFALIPISIFITIITVSSLSHFLFGYRYIPAVANHFNDDLALVRQHLNPDHLLLIPAGTLEYDFYKSLEPFTKITVTSNLPEVIDRPLASLGHYQGSLPEKVKLYRIITSPKTINSDRIYLYIFN